MYICYMNATDTFSRYMQGFCSTYQISQMLVEFVYKFNCQEMCVHEYDHVLSFPDSDYRPFRKDYEIYVRPRYSGAEREVFREKLRIINESLNESIHEFSKQ